MGQWLAQELKRIRAARKMSLRQVAGAAGLPHMTYVGYELGKAAPPPHRRPALAGALGIAPQTLDELIEEDAYEVFLRSRPLSEEGREAVRQFLKTVRERERKRQQQPRGERRKT